MKVNGRDYRTVWMEGSAVCMIDQNLLPFRFEVYKASTFSECCRAITGMTVRGAGAIGATAGFAMAQAFLSAPADDREDYLVGARSAIEATRPTARDLFYAAARVFEAGRRSPEAAVAEARRIADENVESAKMIGSLGNDLIADGARIETHCNAGWLGFVDYGSALAPVYVAHRMGKKLFVYVDETRPRNQGSRLTAWELRNEDVPHAIIPDHAGAYLMSKGMIDLVIVGADRIARNGDVANKIGTLDKAILAKEYGIPFYVAAPLSTFDAACNSGVEIVIEERDQDEVLYQTGLTRDGRVERILIANPGSPAVNPAFDITPARLITGIITEKGIINPNTVEFDTLLRR
jgi:S-methyl-5-thioribose-1-phosphate isomerase